MKDRTVKLTVSFFVNTDGSLSETGKVFVRANKRHGITHSPTTNVSSRFFQDRYTRYQAIDHVIAYMKEQLEKQSI